MSIGTAPPTQRPPLPPAIPAGQPPLLPPGEPPRKPWYRRTVVRLLLGCLIVLLASAATSAVFVSGEITTLRNDLSQNPSLQVAPGSLASAGFGAPQTLLLVGDDQRALTKYYHQAVLPHANEMLLVRLDPSKPWISMMSIPRELQVTIDTPHSGQVTTRFNYAYTAGGIPLLLSTIRRVLRLSVNHVVVITFGRFKRAVDQMGCVYSTVDRRYYHVNVPGGEQYQEIDLQPGYQQMCGPQSLQFVSYRHNDTSLVRDARDQSFLLDVKRQYGPTLADHIHKFEQIFGQAVLTDPALHTTSGVLDLLGTLISSSGRRVRQVHFQANLLATYDTASPQQIAASVHSFLFGGSSLPKRGTASLAHAVRRGRAAAALPLSPTPPSELAQASTAASSVSIPYEYPRVEDRAGSAAPVYYHGYVIRAPDGSAYPIYVAVFSAGQLGQFYDVQGTTWTTAPQFDSPDQTVHVGGRTYYLYYNAETLKMVAWYEHGVVYWVRNSLLDSIGNGELLAIAEQTRPLGRPGTPVAPAHVALQAVAVPFRSTVQPKISLTQTIGSVGGLLTLAAVPLLVIALFKRRREIAELRGQLGRSLQVEAQMLSWTHTARVPYTPALAPATVPTPPKPARRQRRRASVPPALIVAAVAVAVGAAGGVAALDNSQSGHASRPPVRPAARRLVPAVPTVRVAVLNAGSIQGAAGRLAGQLRADRVSIGLVGNVTETRPPGTWILYAPGAGGQAAKLAHLMTGQSPSVAPIDPTAQAAAGPSAQLVVVIA